MSSEKLTVLSINHAHIMAQNASDKKDYARMREIWLKVRDNLDIIVTATITIIIQLSCPVLMII